MILDKMDYLRQQIEASLGRSEELILLDKAKCDVFYRYPGEPPPISTAKKRSPKERGTFNSVRLKKYLGIGSKRKQRGSEDDNNSSPQQPPLYMGELHYGSYYGVDANQFPLYQPEYHRRKALSYDTVSVGRSIHYPNMYATVSVRSSNARGTVCGVYPWPEQYLQPATCSGPLPEVCECPCTCEKSVLKSKKHRNTCTCAPGTRSKWWTRRLSRPSLFNGSMGDEDVSEMNGIKKREGKTTATANQYEQTPSARSRLYRLSDLSSSSEMSKDTFSRSSDDFLETAVARKSILECPVNPYELLSKRQESPRQSTGSKKLLSHEYEDLDDRFGDISQKDHGQEQTKAKSRGRKSTPNAFRSISSGRRFQMDNDIENDAPDISLGGQRIRLFGTVNGNTNKTIKRPSLPSFTERSTFESELKNCPVNRNETNRTADNSMKTLDSTSHIKLKTNSSKLTETSHSDDDWLVDDEPINYKNGANKKNTLRTLSDNSCNMLAPRKSSVQHKTKISIGGKPKIDVISNDCKSEKKSGREPTYMNISNESSETTESDMSPCHTVISVGHSADSASSCSNKLNLKINFNELSAYLKPILKKSPYNESSTSTSEAEGSETYSSTPSVSNSSENAKNKQKKHVHFLSNRRLSPSSELAFLEDEEASDKLRNKAIVDEDSDRETQSTESESFRSGGIESEEELLSSSSSSTQDLYDDGVSISRSNDKVIGDRVRSWSPDTHFSTRSHASEKKNVVFSTSTDDMAVIGIGNSNSDVKKFNLRRSLSERQVAADSASSVEENSGDKSTRLSPMRSHSFQTVVSLKATMSVPQSILGELSPNGSNSAKNSIPGKNAVVHWRGSSSDDSQLSTFVNSSKKSYLKSSPTVFRKKYVNEDINHHQQQQPVYQNSCNNTTQSQMVANILAKCNSKNSFSKESVVVDSDQKVTTHHRQFPKHCLTSSSSVDSRLHTNDSESTFNKHFNSLDKKSLSGSDKKIGYRSDSPNSLGIAQMKAIPKFLPRPSYIGKHVPVCSLYDNQPKFQVNSEEDVNSHDWSSEEDLYTDGTSHLCNKSFEKRFGNNQSLPPIPIDRSRQSTERHSDDSDDNGIYEKIGEPLYEEVPDTISYSSGTSAGTGSMGHPRKSIFEGASKTEILNYLEDAKERGVENIPSTEDAELLQAGDVEDEVPDELENQPVDRTKRNHRNRISNLSNLSDSSQTSEESFQNDNIKENDTRHGHSTVEVERNDSGVGSETSKPSRLRRQSRLEECNEQLCVDCDLPIDKLWDKESNSFYVEPLVCKKCSKKRCERKEIILEFVETEIKYGRDLRIIKEEFHRPMLVAGLLSEELLSNIFLNLDQLIEVNDKFTEKLKDALDIAAEQGDEDYNTVNVGKIFLDSSSMLPAFEVYCVRQGTASLLLTNLEKEKELLRIFLKVSQMENTLLRRLNLNSFLMVPVQRVTKYPLLINRLYKVTPHHHQDREALREAQLKIELHLEHINQQAKDFSGMNIWRRISNMSNPQRRSLLEPIIGNIKMRKMALEILQWNNDEVRFVMEGRLQYTQINENLWNKRDKSLKLTAIHGLLITLGNPNSDYRPDLADREIIFPRNTGIKEATLVLIKEKNSRFNLIREPIALQKCVISCDPETEDMFEVQELTSKEAYLIKGDDIKDTQEWLKMLRYHAKDLGAWRRRRNALANIMINGMAARREWL